MREGAGRSDASAGRAAWPGPEAPRAETKENHTYCSKLVRSSQATSTETAKAARPNRRRHDEHLPTLSPHSRYRSIKGDDAPFDPRISERGAWSKAAARQLISLLSPDAPVAGGMSGMCGVTSVHGPPQSDGLGFPTPSSR